MNSYIKKATMHDLEGILILHKKSLPYLKWSYDRGYVFDCIDSGNCYVCYIYNPTSPYTECLAGCFHIYRERKYLWLNTIAVAPEYQGNGYGSKMMNKAEEMALNLHYPQIKLWTCVNHIEKYSHYYENMGYEKIGVIETDEENNRWQAMIKNIK